MHTPDTDETRNGHNVQQAESQSHAESDSEDLAVTIATFTLCDVDLPCIVPNGAVYMQAPIQGVFDAFAAYISEGLSNLEARISEARSTALAFDGIQRTVFGEGLVIARVVSGGGK